MNLKKSISFIFIFLTSILISIQSSVSLDWKTVNYFDSELTSFNESVYLSEYNGLPSYQKIKRLNQNYYYEIEIYDTKFTDVTDKEKKLEYLDISNTLIYHSDIKFSSDIPYQITILFPYVKVVGSYKKIIEFQYKEHNKKVFTNKKKKSQKIESVLKNGDWFKISVDENFSL